MDQDDIYVTPLRISRLMGHSPENMHIIINPNEITIQHWQQIVTN